MNQETTQNIPTKLSNTRCLRLNKSDDDRLKALCKATKDKGWDLDIVQAIRDAVNLGLPHLEEKWGPILNETTSVNHRTN